MGWFLKESDLEVVALLAGVGDGAADMSFGGDMAEHQKLMRFFQA